jgi:hypothetical protein
MTAMTRLRSMVAAVALFAPMVGHAEAMPAGSLVGIVAVSSLFVLGIIALAMLGPQWFLRSAMRERTELINKLLAAGQPVPPELFKPLPPPPSGPPPLPAHEQAALTRARLLRLGVALLGWGAGIAAVAYFGFNSPRAASWGLLFLALSLACFVNARFFAGERARD